MTQKKKRFRILLLSSLTGFAVSAWILFGPTVSAPEGGHLLIRTGSSYEQVKTHLRQSGCLRLTFFFDLLARGVGYPHHIRAGRFTIASGSSLWELVRTLYSGRQSEVRLTLNKLRTKEDLAGRIAAKLEPDSLTVIRFLLSNDSLAPYGYDTNTVMTAIIPNSYLFWWNGSIRQVFERLNHQHDLFWEGRRQRQADSLGLSPAEVYTLASIVEEETYRRSDKGKIASVYLNRLQKNMKLQADPTVKYALRQFGLKRVRHGHLTFASPYNTYHRAGLPPGPICTPSIETIDAVLQTPRTDFLYFVARSDFSGYSEFAATYGQHLTFARAYQRALDSLTATKAPAP